MQPALVDAFSNSTARHVGLIYTNRRDQFDAAVPFIRAGLERGEHCVYVANENGTGDVLDAMRDGGIDLDRARDAGALRVITERDAYLKRGNFEPGRMIDFMAEAALAARRDGFTALRVTGEMTWALSGAPGTDRLLEYEARIDKAIPSLDAEALCQYSRSRFPDETIEGAIRLHPHIVVDGALYENPFYARRSDGGAPRDAALTVDGMLQAIGRQGPTLSSTSTTDRRLDVPAGAVISASLRDLVTPFIDGELPETTAAEVARQISADPGLTRLLEAQRATKRAVARLVRSPLPDTMKARIRRLIFPPPTTTDP